MAKALAASGGSPSTPPGRWAWFGAGMGLSAAIFGTYFVLIAPTSAPRVTASVRPTPVPVTVQVAGAVPNPGVYILAAGSRIEDAIAAAGGMIEDADPESINLATRVTDGQRVTVGSRPSAQRIPESNASGATQSLAQAADSHQAAIGPLNLNTATAAELDSLPGIGPVTAQKIVAQRSRANFRSVEELRDLKLVSPATYQRIKDRVTVS